MSAYLDASVIVPTLVDSPPSPVVHAYLIASAEAFIVSDFAAAEVASALSRLVRARELGHADALARLATFDRWLALDTTSVTTEPADIQQAAALVRRFELKLRTPDALQIAICARSAARLVTRDGTMAQAGTTVGIAVTFLL